MVHEVVDDDCVVEPVGCAGEVKELGASRKPHSRQTSGVEGGAVTKQEIYIDSFLELSLSTFVPSLSSSAALELLAVRQRL